MAVCVVHLLRMNDPRAEAESGAAEPQDTRRRAGVRCVAVLPPHRDEPAELRAAMGRRGVSMTCYRSVYDALLAVIGASEHGAVALVVVDSGSFSGGQADRLVSALARRVERVSAWSFDSAGGEAPRLRAYAPAEPLSVEVVQSAVDEVREWVPTEAPRLRLAGFHDDDEIDEIEDRDGDVEVEIEHDEDDVTAVEVPGTVSEMLTGEEIAMLLDDLPGGDSFEESKA